VQPNGRAVIEINDDTGDLIGLITSTTLPMLTVDAAWRGRAYLADGTHQSWALAIGHASADDDDLTAISHYVSDHTRTHAGPWSVQHGRRDYG